MQSCEWLLLNILAALQVECYDSVAEPAAQLLRRDRVFPSFQCPVCGRGMQGGRSWRGLEHERASTVHHRGPGTLAAARNMILRHVILHSLLLPI